MTDEQTIASEVRDFVLENLRTYTTRGEGAAERILADFAPDVSFIPAGANQEVQGIDEMEVFVRREFAQHPSAIEIDVLWTKVRVLCETLAVVELATNMQFSDTVTMQLRGTFVCEKRQGRWWIANLHGSLPSRAAPDELWPVDVLRARNAELERQVAEHTAKLEAAHHEAQIEAALERVRSRTMAMHHSDELREVVVAVFEQLQRLGFDVRECEILVFDKETLGMEMWGSGFTETTLHDSYRIPFLDHPFYMDRIEAWRRGVPYEVIELSGALKQSYDRLLFEETDLKHVPEVTQAAIRAIDSFWISNAFMRHGVLETISTAPLPDDEAATLQRFAKVFEQTYTRFLDLKQAEAQAGEAQIEAALERVRARTMAMQESAELAEVIKVVFREALRLGFGAKACDLVILDEATGASTFWISGELDINEGEALHFRVLPIDHPHYAAGLTAWKNKEAVRHAVLEGEDCARYMRLLTASVEGSNVPEDVKDFIQGLRYIVHTEAYMRHGYFRVASLEPLREEAAGTLQRFARVFEQTYTRFLDLKQAEAQAREARIEAALERVRARAMAMHRSDELPEAVAVVFEEMQRLGFPSGMCMIILYDEETGAAQFWVSGLTESVWPESYHVSYLDHPIYVDHFKAWQQGVPYLTVELSGETKRNYDQLLFEETDFKKLPEATRTAMMELDNLWLSNAFMSSGTVQAVGPESLPDDKAAILQRFAKVIDLTYTRVDDLQQAEARAKEAQQQASLDRVRAEIASMRTAADLQHITPLVWRELTTVGVPFFRCGVFIIDEATERVHTYLSTPEGRSLAVLHLPFDSAETTREAVEHWRRQQVYTERWDRQQFTDWVEAMREQSHIDAAETYQGGEAPPETLALQFVPFTQGMLYVGSAAPLPDDQIDLVQALADAFSVAYARYEDFTQLEAAKRRVEATLADLKATQAQLIHSEKMASLGQMTTGIAHEIKNPLNFVNNFAELNEELADELAEALAQGEDPSDILTDLKRNAASIARHGKRADGIVRSMMQHARGGTGEREPLAINMLVEEYVNLANHGMRASTPGFTVDIERAYEEEVGQVPVMRQEIGRALLNLLSNAFDAVHEQAQAADGAYTPTVHVSTRRNGDTVEILIRDNGPGIKATLREKIFEPFFTTKPTGSGTGLGLSLSYDIVTQGHRGLLAVESIEGEGATFIITLPTDSGT